MSSNRRLGASFRDPSGFLFRRGPVLYRQVNQRYREDYDRLMQSGLYEQLTAKGRMVAHEEVDVEPAAPELAYKVIEPQPLAFISYPYEWSFSQLKDAALLTLRLQKLALEHDLSLKDASAYNIQFHNGRPILIDTLSFERYKEGEPWVAYRQFCQHFLAPLALMAYKDVRLSQMLRVYMDGIPLDLTGALLPTRSRLNFGLATHVHLHASSQKRYAGEGIAQGSQGGRQMGRTALLGLVDSLEATVRGLNWKPAGTEWGDYYQDTNYSAAAFEEKKGIVAEFVQRIRPASVWDLGANTGVFSLVAAEQGARVISFDIDPAAVEKNYLDGKQRKEKRILPLVLDLTNPSPGIGWANQERDPLLARGPADAVLALALVHHLAISNNVPLPLLADFFSWAGQWLVVEFIPKSDLQVQRLLTSREDIFSNYTREDFEQAFSEKFCLRDVREIEGSQRVLYLMEKLKFWMKWTRFPFLHPLLFFAYPTLALLANNIKEVSVGVAVRPLAVSLLACALIFSLLRLLIKDWHKAALATTLIGLLFFSYGQVYQFLHGQPNIGLFLGRHRYLLLLYGALLAAGLWLIFSRRGIPALTPFVNVAALAAVLLPLLQVGNFTVSSALTAHKAQAAAAENISVSAEAELPDVYYIILDTYTRADVLQSDYGFDNQPFLDELRQIGFYVADCSMSNYASTELSLSTSLNMNYLEKLAPEFQHMETLASDAHTSMPELMRYSRVRRDLEKIGYQTVAFDTGFAWSSISDADTYLAPGGTNAPPGGLRLFELMLLKNTAASLVLDYQQSRNGTNAVGNYPYYNEHIQRELFKLEQLPNIPALQSPKFVFAHILIPHTPYVFAADGSIRTDVGFYQNAGAAVNPEYEREGYVGQVEYINQRILEILRQILKRSSKPPVIVLQGDHGLSMLPILNAYYLPDAGEQAPMYPSISPVNSFRLVFNTYFGTSFPLLEDKHFFSFAEDRFNLTPVVETNPSCRP